MKWNVLILAGDRGPGEAVAQHTGVRCKAFAPIDGRPMIERVIEAVEGAQATGRIAVSIAPDAPALPDGIERFDAGPTPATSVGEGVAALGTPCLVTTADHPLLTPAMIDDFLASETGDAAAAAALRPVVEAAGNPARRTYLKFADGDLSGCNMFAIRTDAGKGAIRFWKSIEADRKKPWKMAWQVGLWPLLLYVSGRLKRAGAERAIGRLIGADARIICLDHPDAAHDVDKVADLEFAERRLRERRSAE